MKNTLLIFSLVLVAASVFGQKDTVVVHDYTQVMIAVEKDGTMSPVTSLSTLNTAGFFMSEVPKGMVRICNKAPLTIWVNGRLIKKIDKTCDFFDAEDFHKYSISDTLFISIHSSQNLVDLSFDEMVIQDLLVIKDDPKLSRTVRDVFKEFNITAFIIILFLFGIIALKFPSRLTHVSARAFSLKQNSYEFVSTQFFSDVGVSLLLFLSLFFAFLDVYIKVETGFSVYPFPTSYLDFLLLWLKTSLYILMFLLLKWLFITLIAMLFGFRKMNNFQLFDFINFGLIFGGVIATVIVLDFLFDYENILIQIDFQFAFILILGSFIVWFTLKFVNNSPHKKLLIISYLCATEIIPAMLLIGRFYK